MQTYRVVRRCTIVSRTCLGRCSCDYKWYAYDVNLDMFTGVISKVTLCCRIHNLVDLTRFNKIATQGAPQMAVDKEANSLSYKIN